MTEIFPVVLLLDVDNTLLDKDRVITDLKQHLTQAFGADRQQEWARKELLQLAKRKG